MRVRDARWHWRTGTPLHQRDVHLPHGWHLNRGRVPVPPVPPEGPARDAEIERHRLLLPPHRRNLGAYHPEAPFWEEFLQWEHDVRRASTFRGDINPEAEEWELPATEDVEEEESDDDDWGFSDSDDDMEPEEEAAYVPPYYQAAMPQGLDEEAALALAMRESEQTLQEDAIKEEARWQGTAQALHASAAEAGLPPQQIVQLPPPPPPPVQPPPPPAPVQLAPPPPPHPAWPWKAPEWYDLDP